MIMSEVERSAPVQASQPRKIPDGKTALRIPPSSVQLPPQSNASRVRNSHINNDTFSPVNENGSFEFDRVLKAGYVQKRTRKTKAWKPIYLVLRSNYLSIYKDQNEAKLRHKILLADLTTVAFLKDPKQKRQNVFGLFSPSRNYHLEAASHADAEQWVALIRQEARIEEEEEEMFLASPGAIPTGISHGLDHEMQRIEQNRLHDERVGSSSPEPSELARPVRNQGFNLQRLHSHTMDYSGNELASHSDMSDTEGTRARGASMVSLSEDPLAVKSPGDRPMLAGRNTSQMSGFNAEQDPERIIWQGHLLYLKSKGGVRQWKDLWAVIRHKNVAFYKNESEYSPILIIPLTSVINAVEIDPVSKTKRHCMQVITEEKSYKFCAHNEVSLDTSLGAFKCLLARRKTTDYETRVR
ncbi:PH domain-containing protein [Phlyctema vagabunda]|uniref:PH domain-containing protein n=1 Tax=Phlyctema vagabunda TaxID=108571 RepID=A0ABR4PIM9_9HELO